MKLRIEVETSFRRNETIKHILGVLTHIPDDDLVGLAAIRVVDKCTIEDDAYRFAPYLRGYLRNGYYGLKTDKEPAEIVLYASDIFFGIPSLLSKSRLARLKLGGG